LFYSGRSGKGKGERRRVRRVLLRINVESSRMEEIQVVKMDMKIMPLSTQG